MSELNPQQQAVVHTGGGVCLVLAGAGTGKTRTLTRRLQRLLGLGVPPERICLLTFTNRAAATMVERLEGYGVEGVERLWAGTFHCVAAQLLREQGHRIGVEPHFSILDQSDALELMSKAAVQVGVWERKPGTKRVQQLLDLYSACLQRACHLETILQERHPLWFSRRDGVRAIFGAYMARKQALRVMDFDDLLLGWRQLLQSGQGGTCPGGFEHVLVDEYQDINRLQGQIVELLAAPCGNLTVVGDDAQSIYGFRGANPEEILNFEQRFARCRVLKLEQNYRSTGHILSLANASIAHNAHRHPKTLQGQGPKGDLPTLVPCKDERQQAAFVAQRIAELVAQGTDPAEIAVLYRAHWHSNALQQALGDLNVAFSLHSGLPFFERAHIKDALSWLKAMHNPRDAVALRRLLLRMDGVGARTAERIAQVACAANHADLATGLRAALTALALKGRVRAGVAQLALASAQPGDDKAAWLRPALEGWLGQLCLEGREDPERRFAELMALADFAHDADNLTELLTDAALLTSERGRILVHSEQVQSCVTLSTIHKSKGLEWDVVFVIGLAQGRFPLARAAEDAAELEEERRLFHVAVTRARHSLTLTFPRRGRLEGRMGGLGPSVFLKELGGLQAPWWTRLQLVQDPSEPKPAKPLQMSLLGLVAESKG